jgi:hypothetical protein
MIMLVHSPAHRGKDVRYRCGYNLIINGTAKMLWRTTQCAYMKYSNLQPAELLRSALKGGNTGHVESG